MDESRETLLNPFNVRDDLKDKTVESIRQWQTDHSIPYSVAVYNVIRDFNMASVIRNAVSFGFRRMYIIGSRKWDRRGTVGAHHYLEIVHCEDFADFCAKLDQNTQLDVKERKEKIFQRIDEQDWTDRIKQETKDEIEFFFSSDAYSITALEIPDHLSSETLDKIKYFDYNHVVLKDYTCLLLGEEGRGIPEEDILSCDTLVSIPMRGCMRSLNTATASGIVMAYMSQQYRSLQELLNL